MFFEFQLKFLKFPKSFYFFSYIFIYFLCLCFSNDICYCQPASVKQLVYMHKYGFPPTADTYVEINVDSPDNVDLSSRIQKRRNPLDKTYIMSETVVRVKNLKDNKNNPLSILRINHDLLIDSIIKKAIFNVGNEKKEILTYPLWRVFLEEKTIQPATDQIKSFLLTEGEISVRKSFVKVL